MAAIMSDGPGGVKWMDTGKPNTVYIDITGHRIEPVLTNPDGWGQFAVNSGSVSVWVEQSSQGVEDKKVDASFTCHNGQTVWGQNVYAVGSIPELGNWDTDKARILGSKNYPVWKNTLSHLPPDTYIEWKCIKKDGAGNVEWQPGSNNKFTTPTSGTGVTSGSF
jgi:alpha-amylase